MDLKTLCNQHGSRFFINLTKEDIEQITKENIGNGVTLMFNPVNLRVKCFGSKSLLTPKKEAPKIALSPRGEDDLDNIF